MRVTREGGEWEKMCVNVCWWCFGVRNTGLWTSAPEFGQVSVLFNSF